MTKVDFFIKDNRFIGFSCSGHSGYDVEGYDIVCASVSTAVQFVANYLMKYHSSQILLEVDDKNCKITLRSNCLFKECHMQISILEDFAKDLKEQYPEYFTFDYLEV